LKAYSGLIIALAALASAANAAPTAPAQPSQAVIKAAQFHLSIIMSALKATEIPNEMKAGLFGCLYEHPLGDISARVTKVFAENKQAKSDDPNTALMVIARVCGAVPEAPAAAKPAPPKANGSNGAGR